MNGQINAARDVTKTNTSQVETFRSLEFGGLGVADAEKVRFYRAPPQRQTLKVGPQTRLGRVDIVMNYAGADGLVVRSLVAKNFDRPGSAGFGFDGRVHVAGGSAAEANTEIVAGQSRWTCAHGVRPGCRGTRHNLPSSGG